MDPDRPTQKDIPESNKDPDSPTPIDIPESSMDTDRPPSPDLFTDLQNRLRIYNKKIQPDASEDEKAAFLESLREGIPESSIPTPADYTNLYNRLKAAFLRDPHPSEKVQEWLKSMGSDMPVPSLERPKLLERTKHFSLKPSNSAKQRTISIKERRRETMILEKYDQEPIKLMVPPSCERKSYLGFKMIEEFSKLNSHFGLFEKEKSNMPSVFWEDRASELMPREESRILQHGIEQKKVAPASDQSCTFLEVQQLSESEESHASCQNSTLETVQSLSRHNCAEETESVAHVSLKRKMEEEYDLEPVAHASHQEGTFKKVRRLSTHNYEKETESVAHTSHQSFKLSKRKCEEEYDLEPVAHASHQEGTFKKVRRLSTHNYAEETESIAHTSHQSSKLSKGTELEPVAQASDQSGTFKKVQQLPEPKFPETKLTNSHVSATPLNQKDQPKCTDKIVPEPKIKNYAFYNEPYNELLLKASKEYKDPCASGPCSFQTKKEIGFASCLQSEEMWDTSLSTNLQQRWGTKSLVSKDFPSPNSVKLRNALIKKAPKGKKGNASATKAKPSHLVPLLLKNWSYGTQACMFEFNKYESSSTSKEKSGKEEGSGEGKKESSKEDNSDEGATKKKKSGDTNR